MVKSLRYGKYKIGVEYTHLKDCYGLYDPNKKILQIDKRQKGFRLFNTWMHELFHIIMYHEEIDVNKKGEEPIAKAVGDGYEKIFRGNPRLKNRLYNLLRLENIKKK
jgi:hypothetical protein|tara:strand:+ start:249 stop:569 length:321 start_codon:yes stop_codon:yes gene_type:complete